MLKGGVFRFSTKLIKMTLTGKTLYLASKMAKILQDLARKRAKILQVLALAIILSDLSLNTKHCYYK
jgi:hypothetical protein